MNNSFFQELANSVSENGIILIIYFANNEINEKTEEKFKKDTERIKSFLGDKRVTIVKATEENFIEEIKSADVIYIRGGDTQKLKDTLDGYPGFKELIKGKTVAGSSAGAYVLSTYYYTNSKGKVLEGYGCLPLRVVCHYQSTIHPAPEDSDPVANINKFNNNLELVLLKDHEWCIFTI